MVKERLDRALATPNWMDLFPNVKLVDLIASHSDHNPILLPVNLDSKSGEITCSDLRIVG